MRVIISSLIYKNLKGGFMKKVSTERAKSKKAAPQVGRANAPASTEKNVTLEGGVNGRIRTTKRLVVNGVTEEFSSFEEFANRVRQLKNMLAGDGQKNVSVYNKTAKKLISKTASWDEFKDGDEIKVRPKGNAGAIEPEDKEDYKKLKRALGNYMYDRFVSFYVDIKHLVSIIEQKDRDIAALKKERPMAKLSINLTAANSSTADMDIGIKEIYTEGQETIKVTYKTIFKVRSLYDILDNTRCLILREDFTDTVYKSIQAFDLKPVEYTARYKMFLNGAGNIQFHISSNSIHTDLRTPHIGNDYNCFGANNHALPDVFKTLDYSAIVPYVIRTEQLDYTSTYKNVFAIDDDTKVDIVDYLHRELSNAERKKLIKASVMELENDRNPETEW